MEEFDELKCEDVFVDLDELVKENEDKIRKLKSSDGGTNTTYKEGPNNVESVPPVSTVGAKPKKFRRIKSLTFEINDNSRQPDIGIKKENEFRCTKEGEGSEQREADHNTEESQPLNDTPKRDLHSVGHSGEFVLRSARQADANHVVQRIRQGSISQTPDGSFNFPNPETEELFTIIRRSSGEIKTPCSFHPATENPRRRSVITSELIRKFEHVLASSDPTDINDGNFENTSTFGEHNSNQFAIKTEKQTELHRSIQDINACNNGLHEIQSNSVQNNSVQSNSVQSNSVQSISVQSNSVQSNSVQCNSVQSNSVQSKSIQSNPVLSSNATEEQNEQSELIKRGGLLKRQQPLLLVADTSGKEQILKSKHGTPNKTPAAAVTPAAAATLAAATTPAAAATTSAAAIPAASSTKKPAATQAAAAAATPVAAATPTIATTPATEAKYKIRISSHSDCYPSSKSPEMQIPYNDILVFSEKNLSSSKNQSENATPSKTQDYSNKLDNRQEIIQTKAVVGGCGKFPRYEVSQIKTTPDVTKSKPDKEELPGKTENNNNLKTTLLNPIERIESHQDKHSISSPTRKEGQVYISTWQSEVEMRKKTKSYVMSHKPKQPLRLGEVPAWKKELQEKNKLKRHTSVDVTSVDVTSVDVTSGSGYKPQQMSPSSDVPWRLEIDRIRRQMSETSSRGFENELPEWLKLADEKSRMFRVSILDDPTHQEHEV